MVSVAVPVGSTPDVAKSCPFVQNGGAMFPQVPGDPQATFQFPASYGCAGCSAAIWTAAMCR